MTFKSRIYVFWPTNTWSIQQGIWASSWVDILTKNLQKCSLSSPLPNVSFLALTVWPGVNIFKRAPLKPWSRFFPHFTYSIYRLRGRNNDVFHHNRIRTLVALSYNEEKWKFGINCCLTEDILTKINRNVHWVVIYQAYHVCSNLWIWWVAMATEWLKLWKKVKKSTPQKP